MRIGIRSAMASFVVGGALLAASGAGAHHAAVAFNQRVVIYDNGAQFNAADAEYLGEWGFTPGHIAVTKGETIEFVNAGGNARPHTVTSISATGMAPTRTLESGSKFDSSPTRDALIMPGTSWMLDTSTLDPGQYVYYCTLHPWMVGTFTLTAAP